MNIFDHYSEAISPPSIARMERFVFFLPLSSHQKNNKQKAELAASVLRSVRVKNLRIKFAHNDSPGTSGYGWLVCDFVIHHSRERIDEVERAISKAFKDESLGIRDYDTMPSGIRREFHITEETRDMPKPPAKLERFVYYLSVRSEEEKQEDGKRIHEALKNAKVYNLLVTFLPEDSKKHIGWLFFDFRIPSTREKKLEVRTALDKAQGLHASTEDPPHSDIVDFHTHDNLLMGWYRRYTLDEPDPKITMTFEDDEEFPHPPPKLERYFFYKKGGTKNSELHSHRQEIEDILKKANAVDIKSTYLKSHGDIEGWLIFDFRIPKTHKKIEQIEKAIARQLKWIAADIYPYHSKHAEDHIMKWYQMKEEQKRVFGELDESELPDPRGHLVEPWELFVNCPINLKRKQMIEEIWEMLEHEGATDVEYVNPSDPWFPIEFVFRSPENKIHQIHARVLTIFLEMFGNVHLRQHEDNIEINRIKTGQKYI